MAYTVLTVIILINNFEVTHLNGTKTWHKKQQFIKLI